MRYKIILLIFTGVFFTACSNFSKKENKTLWVNYQSYLNIASNKTTAEKERQYFSGKLWMALQSSRAKQKESKNVFNRILHNFTHEITKVSGSKEIINKNTGCLMVMGINVESMPTDYFITYIKENNRWVFNDIHVRYYLDGTKRFLNEAVCDEEKQNEKWLKYMQGQKK